MSSGALPTPPILVLAYRRPDLVREVMRAVADARPKQLFLACDGPHPERPGEEHLVAASQSAMEDAITWDCEVRTRYSEVNQGCRRGVESAISWFFEHVDEGIILEDDCIPHQDFFPYCAELLDRYRHDRRVMHISGDGSLAYPTKKPRATYVFSAEALVWGWATWRRAWEHYDSELELWEQSRNNPSEIAAIFGRRPAARWWSQVLGSLLLEGIPDSWAYRWSFSVMANHGLCIIPMENLVSNVGFRHDSTHTFDPLSRRANVASQGLLPLRHPDSIRVDSRLDHRFQRQLRGFSPNPVARLAKRSRKKGLRTIANIRSILGRSSILRALRNRRDPS